MEKEKPKPKPKRHSNHKHNTYQTNKSYGVQFNLGADLQKKVDVYKLCQNSKHPLIQFNSFSSNSLSSLNDNNDNYYDEFLKSIIDEKKKKPRSTKFANQKNHMFNVDSNNNINHYYHHNQDNKRRAKVKSITQKINPNRTKQKKNTAMKIYLAPVNADYKISDNLFEIPKQLDKKNEPCLTVNNQTNFSIYEIKGDNNNNNSNSNSNSNTNLIINDAKNEKYNHTRYNNGDTIDNPLSINVSTQENQLNHERHREREREREYNNVKNNISPRVNMLKNEKRHKSCILINSPLKCRNNLNTPDNTDKNKNKNKTIASFNIKKRKLSKAKNNGTDSSKESSLLHFYNNTSSNKKIIRKNSSSKKKNENSNKRYSQKQLFNEFLLKGLSDNDLHRVINKDREKDEQKEIVKENNANDIIDLSREYNNNNDKSIKNDQKHESNTKKKTNWFSCCIPISEKKYSIK